MVTVLKVARPADEVVAEAPDVKDPEERESVTGAPLSATLFPNASSTCTVTAGVIAVPVKELEGPCKKTSLLAEAPTTVGLDVA
jgi:hypothetical protein